MVTRHRLVGDDGRRGARPQRGDARAQPGEEAAADRDVIGALAERHAHGRFRRRGRKPSRRPIPGAALVESRQARKIAEDLLDDLLMRRVA